MTFKIPVDVVITELWETRYELYYLSLQLHYIVTEGPLTARVNDLEVINVSRWNDGLDESE